MLYIWFLDIVDTRPRLEQGGKTATIIAGLRSTTHHGDSFHVHGAPLEGRSQNMVCDVVRTGLQVLFLSVEEGICLPLAL